MMMSWGFGLSIMFVLIGVGVALRLGIPSKSSKGVRMSVNEYTGWAGLGVGVGLFLAFIGLGLGVQWIMADPVVSSCEDVVDEFGFDDAHTRESRAAGAKLFLECLEARDGKYRHPWEKDEK